MEEWVLYRISIGWIAVDLETLEVRYFHSGRKRWYAKVVQRHYKSGRAYFQFGKNRTSVYRNRLVWMWVHRRLIPPGYVIDHVNGDRNDDSPDNLRLMEYGSSHRQGNGVQKDKILQEFGAWLTEQSRMPEVRALQDGLAVAEFLRR